MNIDKEPVFYKLSKMTWVANELICDGRHFFLECFRVPPDWHIWVYMVGSEREAERYHTNIQVGGWGAHWWNTYNEMVVISKNK